MLLAVLAYLGGVLTILSPCILPVLPFVFSRADQPFIKSGLPMLVSMAITFSAVAMLGVVGGNWVVEANQYGRFMAMLLLLFFALTLLSKRLADVLTRPFVALGNWLNQRSHKQHSKGQALDLGTPLLLGVATGLLWAPCAGPILGLILTGAALKGASAQTAVLLIAYGLGAVSSIALVLLAGKGVFQFLKRSLGAGEWIRRGLGLAVLGGVISIALGLDTGFLSRLSLTNTNRIEQTLLNWIHPKALPIPTKPSQLAQHEGLGVLSRLSEASVWLNVSTPVLDLPALKGHVVVIDFWTYSCINCLRSLPYVKAWSEKYKNQGLVVIGVHTPEFAFEKDINNIRRAIHDLGVHYPVAVDNQYSVWQAFNNEYWPAHYFIDAKGVIRHQHFGEGDYEHSERMIQQLLNEAGKKEVPTAVISEQELAAAKGVEAASDQNNVQSPETYLGYQRAEHFVSGNVNKDHSSRYTTPEHLLLNQWGLTGQWTIQAEKAVLDQFPGKIRFQFHARDVHLVMGMGEGHKPVRYRVQIDHHALGKAHGMDTNEQGEGVLNEQRLYQLIRQPHGDIQDHTFEIEFLDPGAQVFAFTFG